MTCPACGCPSDPESFLGSLGSRMHCRCRMCGWDWSVPRADRQDGDRADTYDDAYQDDIADYEEIDR